MESISTETHTHTTFFIHGYGNSFFSAGLQMHFKRFNGERVTIWLLIAALIFSAGYYSAPIFFTTRRGVLEKSFFNQFYWSEFWSGKWTAWKNLEWCGCWTKVKSGAKREWFFVHTAVFERARNWCVKKFSLSERNFFVHVRLLKAVFLLFFLFMRFDYDIVLDLGSFW